MNPLNNQLWQQWRLLWPQLQPILQPILQQAQGARVAMVGGAVRDLCLGRMPNDLDLVAESNHLEDWAAQTNLTYSMFPTFGNVTLKITDPHWPLENRKLDLIRARTETYPIAGASPVVQAGTLEQDLWRRDFTVNALALELTHDGYSPLLIDVTGGLHDLQARQLRPLHTQSLYEDASRLVRAARLGTRLGLKASPELLVQVPQALSIAEQTPRFWREMRLIFDEPEPSHVLELLRHWGVNLPSTEKLIEKKNDLHHPRERIAAWLEMSDEPLLWTRRLGLSDKIARNIGR